MRESGKPMEFGIFDFYKVFSKAFGEEDGAGGCRNEPRFEKRGISAWMLMVSIFPSVC